MQTYGNIIRRIGIWRINNFENEVSGIVDVGRNYFRNEINKRRRNNGNNEIRTVENVIIVNFVNHDVNTTVVMVTDYIKVDWINKAVGNNNGHNKEVQNNNGVSKVIPNIIHGLNNKVIQIDNNHSQINNNIQVHNNNRLIDDVEENNVGN